MPHVLQLQALARPKASSPVLAIHERAELPRIGLLKEKLVERALPPDRGPYQDRDRTLDYFVSTIATHTPRTLDDALLLLVFHLTPVNYEGTWGSIGSQSPVQIIHNPVHVHASDDRMVAGELIYHSYSESPGHVTLTGDEELAVLACGILRRLGYLSYPAKIVKAGQTDPFTSVLVFGPSDEAVSVLLGYIHPATREWAVLDDHEVHELLEVARLVNLLKQGTAVAKA